MMEDKTRVVFDSLISFFPYQPTAGQTEALKRISNFISKSSSGDTYLLKGYAGTGKTTIVSSLVNGLRKIGVKTFLMAPTGRAAKVMSTYSGKAAFTIHRKIYRPKQTEGSWISYSLAPNTHSNCLFIVDEASMIYDKSNQTDLFNSQQNLLKDLLDYVSSGNNCRLLLIGDLAQLPPVGQTDSPALDIKLLTRHYGLKAGHYELTEVVRQSSESGVLYNATRLRNVLKDNNINFSFKLFPADLQKVDPSDLGELLSQDYSSLGPEGVVVICRSNRSANNYNRQIRFSGMWFDEEISAGDYLMCVKNNYFWLDDKSTAGFIANGDTLLVKRVGGIEENFGFRFVTLTVEMIDYPNQPPFEIKAVLDSLYTESPALTQVQYNSLYKQVAATFPETTSKTARQALIAKDPFYQAVQIKFAYAITCHKAQGGQWKNVIVDQGYLTQEMIDSNYLRWLYTAITRATEKVYLVNFADSFFEIES